MGTLQLYIAAVVIVVVVVVVVVVVIGLIQYTEGRTKQSQGIKMKVLFVVAVLVCAIMKTSMGMGMGMVPPSYLRSAVFINNSNEPVTVRATFESGASEEHVVQAGGSKNVERDINQGSYSIVDPITAAVVESANNGVSHVDVSTVGIQQLKFSIGVQDGSLSLERV